MTDPECVIDTSVRVVGNLQVHGDLSSRNITVDSISIQAASTNNIVFNSATPLESLVFRFYKIGPLRFMEIPRIQGTVGSVTTNPTTRLISIRLPSNSVPPDFDIPSSRAYRSPVVIIHDPAPLFGSCYYELNGVLFLHSSSSPNVDIPPTILTYRV